MPSVEIGAGGAGPAGGGGGTPAAGRLPARTTAMQAIGVIALLSAPLPSAAQNAAAAPVSSEAHGPSRARATAPVPDASGGVMSKASHICRTASLPNNLISACRATVAAAAAAGGRRNCPTLRKE